MSNRLDLKQMQHLFQKYGLTENGEFPEVVLKEKQNYKLIKKGDEYKILFESQQVIYSRSRKTIDKKWQELFSPRRIHIIKRGTKSVPIKVNDLTKVEVDEEETIKCSICGNHFPAARSKRLKVTTCITCTPEPSTYLGVMEYPHKTGGVICLTKNYREFRSLKKPANKRR